MMFLGRPVQWHPAVLCFTADVFFSSRVLRAPSADRRETLPRDRKYVVFYNLCPKILRALPEKIGHLAAKRKHRQ